MSTRWYPLYAKGNPQLRVYLPNFWMKIVKPHKYTTVPPNVVEFHCSMEMTKFDIKNYLEKIYGVQPASVRTRIALGPVKEYYDRKGTYKEGDVKVAYITLPANQTFTYPDLFPKEEAKPDVLEEKKKAFKKSIKEDEQNAAPYGMGWFAR